MEPWVGTISSVVSQGAVSYTHLDVYKRQGQARPRVTAATDPVLEQVTLVDACAQQRITLQVEHLTLAVS